MDKEINLLKKLKNICLATTAGLGIALISTLSFAFILNATALIPVAFALASLIGIASGTGLAFRKHERRLRAEQVNNLSKDKIQISEYVLDKSSQESQKTHSEADQINEYKSTRSNQNDLQR